MIPPAFIFDETQETIANRAYRDKIATGMMSFFGIGLGAAAGFAVLTTLFVPRFAEVPGMLVSALVFAVLLVPTYLLHRRFAFFSEAAHGEALPRYAVVQLAALFAAGVFSFVAYGIVGMPHLGTGLLVFLLTVGVNYSILRRWAFASR